MTTRNFNTIDEYISSFPAETRQILKRLRKLIHDTEPEVTEDMSYKMPSFKLNSKPLVYFAAWKSHIGFYPTPNGIEEFKKDLAPYTSGKGSAQFPLNKPIPWSLIKEIVKFRAKGITSK